jgi:hypothetical protein
MSEINQVILHNNRLRTNAELWWLRLWKIITCTHLRTLYDTWRWRGTNIEKMFGLNEPGN